MRILFVTNLYPPYCVGGYEQLCMDVAEGLKGKGHEVYVLTSFYGMAAPRIEGEVYRVLRLTPEFPYEVRRISPLQFFFEGLRNLRWLQKVIKGVRPDIVYVWNMGSLQYFLLNKLDETKIPVAYHLGDPWIKEADYWVRWFKYIPKNPLKRFMKSLLRCYSNRIAGMYTYRKLPALRHVNCSCQALKEELLKAGVPIENASICYEGIPTSIFYADAAREPGYVKESPRLLYAGQLVEAKGVYTVVEAIEELVRKKNLANVSLTILGSGPPKYVEKLNKMVTDKSLSGLVKFLKPVPREQLRAIFLDHDIFIFPSIWEEPWSLMLLIGLACGVPVAATSTGGSKEILVDGENSLVFPAGNHAALADRLRQLISNSDLRKKIALNGQKLVRERYDIKDTVDEMEAFLKNALSKSAGA